MSYLKPIGMLRTNREIQDFLRNDFELLNGDKYRSKIEIGVIDDQPFTPQVTLQSFGYKFTTLGDIPNFDNLEKYQIILCDIKGVGRAIAASKEGATIIGELKRKYPEKIVIAYSASAQTDGAVRQAKTRADHFISKDIDIEEWVRTLDKWSTLSIDPYKIWQRVRSRLIELDVDTKQILILEDAYVRTIKQKSTEMKLMNESISRSQISADARAVLQGLVSSFIFKILVG